MGGVRPGGEPAGAVESHTAWRTWVVERPLLVLAPDFPAMAGESGASTNRAHAEWRTAPDDPQPDPTPHQCVGVGVGQGSRVRAWRAAKASAAALVSGPGQEGRARPSIEPMAWTSRVDDVRKASSACAK